MSKESMVPMYRLELVRERGITYTKLPGIEAAAEVFHGMLDSSPVEKMAVIHCNSAGEMIGAEIIAHGSLEKVGADMSDIFRGALRNNAASLWFAHNHPTGGVKASVPDFLFTEKMLAASEILGVRVEDHLVIVPDMHYSIRTNYATLARETQAALLRERLLGMLPVDIDGKRVAADVVGKLPWVRNINHGWDVACDCGKCRKK